MQYILNGIDLETAFGITINNGVTQLLAFPDRKDSLSHDFEDEDGIDIDLAAPRFKQRVFNFDCVMKADDMADLTNKSFALFNTLKGLGQYALYNDYTNLTVFIFYQKQTPKSNGVYSTNKNGVAIDFTLTFSETDPFDNIPAIFLVDHNNRYLVP